MMARPRRLVLRACLDNETERRKNENTRMDSPAFETENPATALTEENEMNTAAGQTSRQL